MITTRATLALLGTLAAALATLGCGGAMRPEIITGRDVPVAQGVPVVERVTDLGDLVSLPANGPLPPPDSDGTFVVGEHVLIEGHDFGRLPTVTVGGRPAGVIARTTGGGILTRIPPSVPVGPITVEVAHPRGKGSAPLAIKRYALVAQPEADTVHLLDVARTDATLVEQRLSIQNPRYLRFSADGSMGYVASGFAQGAQPTREARGPGMDQNHGKLSVVAMAAAGGPKVIRDVPCDARLVVALTVANRAPLLAVVGEEQIQLFSLDDPRAPLPYTAAPLPPDIAAAGVVAADLDPDGKFLALLVADGNRLVSVDVSKPEAPRVITNVDLLPGERVPLVRDMRFSIDGETLWVVSGESPRSLAAGKQPTRITAVSLRAGGAPSDRPVVAVWRTSEIKGVGAPLRLTVGRGQPVASGTTIRTPPEKAAVFVTSIDSRLFQLAGLDLNQKEGRGKAFELLRAAKNAAMLVRTDLEGGGGPLFSVPPLLSAVDVSPDSQVAISTTALIHTEGGADRMSIEFGVTVSPLWGTIKPKWIRLGDMQPDAFKPPFSVGHVRIQP